PGTDRTEIPRQLIIRWIVELNIPESSTRQAKDVCRQTQEKDMSEISRAALFGKLNSLAYKAIEAATVFCKLRGNPYVELVHWIHQILQLQDSDLHQIVRQFSLDPARLAK